MAIWYDTAGNYWNTPPISTSTSLYWPTWHNQTGTSATASTTMICINCSGITTFDSTTTAANNTITTPIYVFPTWHDAIEAPAIVHDDAWHEAMRIQAAVNRQQAQQEREQLDRERTIRSSA